MWIITPLKAWELLHNNYCIMKWMVTQIAWELLQRTYL